MRQPVSLLFAYALPAFALAALYLPLYTYVTPFYVAERGVDLAAIGVVLIAIRLADALSDPAMGWLSDRTPARLGRRRVWLAASVPVIVVGCWQLFSPPEGAGLAHAALWLAVVTLGWTMAQTPYAAWGAEIAPDYDARSRVTGWRESDALQIAIDPNNSQLVYAATAWGVIISTDGGDSWQASNEGLPEYFSKGIVIDHRNTDRLLLATTTGLFESTNRATNWKRISSLPEVAALRLRRSEQNPNSWIAGTEGQGVWISNDDCKTWQATAPALSNANVYGVAIDPYNSSHLAAGGWDAGVHLSSDGGKSWKLVSESFPSQNVTSVIFDDNVPGRLWASTFEEGTFYSDDKGSSWTNAQLDGAYVFDLGFMPKSVKLQ